MKFWSFSFYSFNCNVFNFSTMISRFKFIDKLNLVVCWLILYLCFKIMICSSIACTRNMEIYFPNVPEKPMFKVGSNLPENNPSQPPTPTPTLRSPLGILKSPPSPIPDTGSPCHPNPSECPFLMSQSYFPSFITFLKKLKMRNKW